MIANTKNKSLESSASTFDSLLRNYSDIPKNWNIRQLGRFGRFSKGSGGAKEDEVRDGIHCIRYGDLYTHHQTFINESRACVTEEKVAEYTKLQYGDVLFAGSGETIEEIGKSAVNLISGQACCGGDVILFRPSIEIDAKFLGYVCDCSLSIFQKSCMGRGVTVMHIYDSSLKYMNVALPPISKQKAIASFLDRETRRIDVLVEKQQKLIELLEEKRIGLIKQVVTKGMDHSVPMKDSGVEWIGPIPTHWEKWKMAHAFDMIGSGTTPSSSNEKYYGDGTPWVTTSELRENTVFSTEKSVTPLALKEVSSLRIYPSGSLMIAMYGATIGRLGFLGVPATVNQACCVFSKPRTITYKFAFYWLLAARDILISEANGGGQPNLNQELFKLIRVPSPHIEEQIKICEDLDAKCGKIDTLIFLAKSSIEKLKEYCTTLINGAVSGKIDVHNHLSETPLS